AGGGGREEIATGADAARGGAARRAGAGLDAVGETIGVVLTAAREAAEDGGAREEPTEPRHDAHRDTSSPRRVRRRLRKATSPRSDALKSQRHPSLVRASGRLAGAAAAAGGQPEGTRRARAAHAARPG